MYKSNNIVQKVGHGIFSVRKVYKLYSSFGRGHKLTQNKLAEVCLDS